MAAKRGLTKRLEQEIRKRQKHPRPQSISTGNVRSDRWDEITNEHADVLQNIEATLLDCWRMNEEIDDQTLHLALVAAMRDDAPDHPLARDVFVRLRMMRSLRDDVEPDLWLDALRVVDQSVRDHSSIRHRDRSYLLFILPFVAPVMTDSNLDYEIIEGRVTPPDPPRIA